LPLYHDRGRVLLEARARGPVTQVARARGAQRPRRPVPTRRGSRSHSPVHTADPTAPKPAEPGENGMITRLLPGPHRLVTVGVVGRTQRCRLPRTRRQAAGSTAAATRPLTTPPTRNGVSPATTAPARSSPPANPSHGTPTPTVRGAPPQ